jgi:hypothetical protein
MVKVKGTKSLGIIHRYLETIQVVSATLLLTGHIPGLFRLFGQLRPVSGVRYRIAVQEALCSSATIHWAATTEVSSIAHAPSAITLTLRPDAYSLC